MNGATFPFVAGCIFFGMGAMLILSLLQYVFQRTRWRGRATGTIVSIETLSAERHNAVSATSDPPRTNPSVECHYRPVVAYTVGGHPYQVQGAYSMRSSTTAITSVGGVATTEIRIDPLPYATGQTVSIRYDIAAPANAIVVDRRRELTVFALQIFCGLMSMILGLLVFYMNGNLAWLGPDWYHH
jgi:Protein of unknown function (DUF3592)